MIASSHKPRLFAAVLPESHRPKAYLTICWLNVKKKAMFVNRPIVCTNCTIDIINKIHVHATRALGPSTGPGGWRCQNVPPS
jgi:hypothetical protein